jgi:hypothetical protein
MSKREYRGHPRLYELLDELRDLYNEKNYQYASSEDTLGAFRRPGTLTSKLYKDDIPKDLATCMVYMGKQIDAVYEMVGSSKGDTIEKLPEKLKDIAVYALLATILYEENEKK